MWGVEARPPCTGAADVASIGVDNRSDIRDFLASRRARITPEQAGLLPGGGRRRVPGLRREEVAVLAGVSTDWYTRLEKGHIAGVSEDVLEAVARALQLDEAERTYLFDLARAAAKPPARPQRRGKAQVPPRVQWMLDSMTRLGRVRRQRPAGHRRDQHPRAGAALAAVRRPRGGRRTSPGSSSSTRGRATTTRTGTARPTSPSPCCAPRRAAARTTSSCASSSGSCRRSARSSAPAGPRTTCASTTTAPSSSATPSSATLELGYCTLDLPTEDQADLRLTIYTAEPGTPSEDGLKLLASWAATTAPPRP